MILTYIGAGRGIGADTARLFAKLGATLSLLSTTEQNLLTVASECEQLGHGQPTVGNIDHVS